MRNDTESETSRSIASDSEAEQGGHPLDEVLSRRAAEGASTQPVNGRSTAAEQGSPAQEGSLVGKKRQREGSDGVAAAAAAGGKPPRPPARGGSHSKAAPPRNSSSPESGEVEEVAEDAEGGFDIDDDIHIHVQSAVPSGSSSEPSSGYTSGSSTGSEGDDEAEEGDVHGAKRARLSPLEAPHGVIVLGEGEGRQRENAEVRRLLRMPRYFDEDYEEAGRRCFKCGAKGHMARDCTNQAMERPCFLCAQLGHNSSECPQSLCFRCNRPGHMARDCPYGYKAASWDEGGAPMCLRCGREDCPCAGQRDYVRAEGGCRGEYSRSDLQHVRCADCKRRGHLSCKEQPSQPAKLSCYNCGEGGHTADECWKDTPAAVARERQGGSRASLYGQQAQRSGPASSSGYAAGYSSGGGVSERSGGYQGHYSQQAQQQYGGGGGYHSSSRYQPPLQYGRGGGRYGGGGGGGYSGGQAPRFANYHFASEIGPGYGQQQRQQAPPERYVYDEYGYNHQDSRGDYSRGGRR